MQNILKRITQITITALVALQALPALAVTYTSTSYQVVDPELQAGGVGTSTSTTYSLIGTLGEVAVGRATSASFTSTAGSLGYPRCTTPTLTATAAGAGSIALSWTAATCTGGWTLSSYQYCEGTAADTYSSCTDNSTNLTVTDTATSGVLTFYRVRVIATGAGSSGSPAGNVGSRSNEFNITPTGSGGTGGGGGGGGGGATTTTLSLTAPNGGEMYAASGVQNITWQSTGTISNTALFLSSDGGLSFPTTIATGESNDGTYAWTVPNLTGAQYRVRIEGRTATGVVLISDISNSNFSIGPAGAIPEPEPTPGTTTSSGPPRSADVNSDGKVNLLDFSALLAWYRKPNPPEIYDLNRDGVVNLRDVSIMIFNWRA